MYFLRPLVIVLVALVLNVSTTLVFDRSNHVWAQTNDAENPLEGAVPGGVTSGSASDAELWRQIRQGQPGTVAGGDKSGGLMIQSGGQDWRLVRNGPLPRYAAWAILGTLLLLSLFFALRGRIKIDKGRSGQKMKRFTAIERAGHWLLASSFIVLALTGLNLVFGKALLMPVLGKDVFAGLTVFGKYVHNYVGFAFMLGLLMIVVMWVVHNIPNLHDVKWMLRGGGIIGSGHPPARKFNAGQKIIFWVVVLCGISISLSGWALMNPFTTEMFAGTFGAINSVIGTSYATDLSPIQEQQYQSLWHTIMAVFMVVVVLAHIYIGSIGMEGALDAMTSGEVDTNWAREHHSLWVAEEENKGRLVAVSSASQLSMGDKEIEAGSAVAMAAPTVTPPVPKPPMPTDGLSPLRAKTVVPVSEPIDEEEVAPATAARTADVKPKPKSKPASKGVRKTSSQATSTNQTKTTKSARDDLKRIKGIGPQNEKRLNGIGVTRFEDIAKWTKKEQADIGQRLAFPGRIEREEWVKQAKALARQATR